MNLQAASMKILNSLRMNLMTDTGGLYFSRTINNAFLN